MYCRAKFVFGKSPFNQILTVKTFKGKTLRFECKLLLHAVKKGGFTSSVCAVIDPFTYQLLICSWFILYICYEFP